MSKDDLPRQRQDQADYDASTQQVGFDDATVASAPEGAGEGGEADLGGGASTVAVPLSGAGSLPREHPESFSSRYGDRRFLSSGGMGEVLLVRDLRVGRDLAMKVMHSAGGRAPGADSRFVREARVQGRLEHPSVVPVHDLGLSPDGEPYFVMKRIRGQTLKDIFDQRSEGSASARQKYPRRLLLRALSQLCLALDFAHSKGVVHRDLKPANIMLGDFGEVYLLDWGVAKVRGTGDSVELFGEVAGGGDGLAGQTGSPAAEQTGSPAAEQTGNPAAEQTREGSILGTPGYAAPEQLGAKTPVDARADIYALGVILFELLAEQPLHARRSSVGKILMDTVEGVDCSPAVRAPELDIPPELDAIALRATQQDPDLRYEHMRELHDVLEDFLAGERDEALRGELADGHEAAAAAAAERALEGGAEALAARREAIGEVGKALALRPDSRSALQILVRLMGEPPAEIPPEVAQTLERETDSRVQDGFRLGRWVYATWLTVLPMALWMGVRDWVPVVLGMVLSLAAVATCVVGSRNPRVIYRYLLVIFTALTMMLASRLLGVFMIVPTVLGVNAVSFALTHVPRRRILFTIILSSALVVPLALVFLGILPPSYAFADGKMVVIPRVVALPVLPTLTLLFIISFATVWVSAFWAGKVRDLLWTADTRIALGAWQLEQLMPTEPVSGDPNSRGPDARGPNSVP